MGSRAGGGGGGSRDRFRRDFTSSSSSYPPRFEDSNNNSNTNFTGGKRTSKNPPSRHLWVGNLPHSIMENDLTRHFLHFGELETVAFQEGRSYAFINFRNDDDAIAALKALQGFPLAGNPLRIEFAKADKALAPSRDEDYLQRRDEQRSALKGSPFSQRDSRLGTASPEPFYADKSKMNDKNAEPSEVLWIGFPALLKVDEMILRKAFSPFGDIEKITAFPGRSYAFVRYRNVTSACRAKETLQGKLFGNPRVHICFARNEGGSSGSGRTPHSPQFKSNGQPGGSENFQRDRNFGSLTADSRSSFGANSDPDSDAYGVNRKRMLHPGGDNWRFGEDLGPSPNVYERHDNPTRERDSHFDEFPQKNPQKASYYEEPWDSSEDSYVFHGAKKLKTDSFPPDKELPEYPYSDNEQEKRAFPRSFSDFSQPEVYEKNYGYKPNQERPSNFSHPHAERSDLWKAPYENLQSMSAAVPSNPIERKIFSPEPEPSSLKLWKWEGTIAKGGTPVCHARAFPVGKALDIMLPEFLDCTARTGLDMLAKHYYQAASAFAVFFAPASDSDMGYYNEFMHYLGEKQRAAVAKLDDKTTLFLVPPSEFSEKVLKVPGKLCISGVVLRLELPGPDMGPLHHPNGQRDLGRSGGDPSFSREMAQSGAQAAFSGSSHGVGRISNSYNDNRHNEYPIPQRNPMPGANWSSHHPPNSFSGNRNESLQAYNDSVAQEDGFPHYTGNRHSEGNKSSVPSSLPMAGLQPRQLAQLASSLLGQQQRQSESNQNVSLGEDVRQTNAMNQFENQFRTAPGAVQMNRIGSDISSSQFGQPQQLQQQQAQVSNNMPNQRDIVHNGNSNFQMQNSNSAQEDADGDPQKRLQATLQLAAALLQQIQQGKGT
ncbi:flowering time control protein FPA isoform X2 [Mercurialis annua]|uniref:flowering time control protein FPA isoform X2 n=1 Tax=Mercurialis annua TaxID=3986 RepID=UPI002160A539|nr:flowering time control protein FPA isoform X2 [Mercurialis annua]